MTVKPEEFLKKKSEEMIDGCSNVPVEKGKIKVLTTRYVKLPDALRAVKKAREQEKDKTLVEFGKRIKSDPSFYRLIGSKINELHEEEVKKARQETAMEIVNYCYSESDKYVKKRMSNPARVCEIIAHHIEARLRDKTDVWNKSKFLEARNPVPENEEAKEK